MKDKIRKLKENISNAPHKKKAIIAILIAICMVGGAAGGYLYMTHTDFGKADVASQSDDKELTAEEKEKAAEEELEKAKESGDKEAIEKAENEVEKAKEQVNASNSSSQNSNSNSGASNKGSYSKPSSGNSGSSGTSSSSSKPSKPTHQHNWQPIYKEYTTQIIDPNNPSYIKCNDCGANLGRNGENWMDHADATGHEHGTTRVYNYISHVEKQLVGYKCSCGATK